jgi:hypothetical protein
MRAAALVVLAACGAAAPPPLLTSTAPSRAAPTTPAPVITFASMQLVATGLPAVAADGSLVVHTVVDGDGGRGNPNMVLAVRDRSDREIERFVVVTANESEGQFDDRGPAAPLAAKIDAANRWLADRHAHHDLRPLSPEEVAVELTPSRLTIRARGTLVIETATPAWWMVPDKPMCTTCAEVCHHPLSLGAAHAALAHNLVVITVAYAGTDLCPEPVSQHHVITW